MNSDSPFLNRAILAALVLAATCATPSGTICRDAMVDSRFGRALKLAEDSVSTYPKLVHWIPALRKCVSHVVIPLTKTECNVDFIDISEAPSNVRDLAKSVCAIVSTGALEPFENGYRLKTEPCSGTTRRRIRPDYMHGTGFVYGSDTIATAGHVAARVPRPELRVVFDYYGLKEASEEIYLSSSQVFEVIEQLSVSSPADVALLKIQSAKRNVLVCDERRILRSCESNADCDSVFTIGHPSGFPMQFRRPAAVRSVPPVCHEFSSDLALFDGDSGSPVFNGIGKVVAVHTKGNCSWKAICARRDGIPEGRPGDSWHTWVGEFTSDGTALPAVTIKSCAVAFVSVEGSYGATRENEVILLTPGASRTLRFPCDSNVLFLTLSQNDCGLQWKNQPVSPGQTWTAIANPNLPLVVELSLDK